MARRTHSPKKNRAVKSADGKTIGEIVGDKFIKPASIAHHMLRDPKGWALDVSVIEKLRRAGVNEVIVIDTALGKTWTAPLSLHWTQGVLVDRGSGQQRCVPVEYWQVNSIR